MGNTTAIHNLNDFEVVNEEDCLINEINEEPHMSETDFLLEQQQKEWDNRVKNWHQEMAKGINNDMEVYEALKEEEEINKEIQEEINYEEWCSLNYKKSESDYCNWMENKINEYEEDQRQGRAQQVGKWWVQFKRENKIPKRNKLYNYRSIYEQVQGFVRDGVGKLEGIKLNTYNLRNRS